MRICPGCRTRYEDDSNRFCHKDGLPLIEVSETSTMSGRSRKLAMMPMLNYVNSIRAVMDEVYVLLGYEVSWGGLEILETAEMIQQLDFLKRGRDEGHLNEQEYRRRVRALYGLTGEEIKIIERGMNS